jgi:hypothetical protein
MSENDLEKPAVSAEILRANRLPLGPRLRFQKVAFAMLGLEHDMDNIINKYGKDVSDYIDNPENIEVRDLIMSDTKENYQKAADLVVEEIRKLERLKQAA